MEYDICVKWEGYNDPKDNTWEPLVQIYSDIEESVKTWFADEKKLKIV